MKISPAPWWPCFLTNPNGLNNPGTGSPRGHFCKIILKSVQWFRTRRFLKFSIQIYRENKPRPLVAMFFWRILMAWTILQQDHQRNIFAKLYWNRPSGLDKKIFKVFYIDYRENKPRPLASMFFDESQWLEQSCNRTTNGTFLQNYMEIGPVVSDKKIFSFLYRYIGKISRAPLAAMFFDESKWFEQSW